MQQYYLEPAYKALEESRLPDGIPGCIDVDLVMVRIVEQRWDRTRLLIKTDPYNSLAANTPKDLSRKYNDLLSLLLLFCAYSLIIHEKHIMFIATIEFI